MRPILRLTSAISLTLMGAYVANPTGSNLSAQALPTSAATSVTTAVTVSPGAVPPETVTSKFSGDRLLAESRSVMALAKHLKQVGAKMYGAYWCPHCKHQQALFGSSAFDNINYIECDPKGENARPQLCRAAKVSGYPTWEIKGKLYPGVQTLEELAKLSNYKGPNKF